MKRNIISIDESLCNGCGACVEGCHEGALQMIDGKARIVSELYCDGLGACIGECPVGAITIEEREAEAYNEIAVMERLVSKGSKVILAHLQHLKDHNEIAYLNAGINYIVDNKLNIDLSALTTAQTGKESDKSCVCPGSLSRSFAPTVSSFASKFIPQSVERPIKSELTHWPVQLHLLNPASEHFRKSDLLLAADCTAFAYANFHAELLANKKLAIACPKLDSNKDIYVDKLVKLIDNAMINTLTVVIMEVPCCAGLIQIAQMAVNKAQREITINKIVIGIRGELK